MRLNIKAVLKQRGVKQRRVAEAIGISHGYMSGLCSGAKSPSNDILLRIATYLDVTPNDLYDLSDEATDLPTLPLVSLTEIRAVPLSAHLLAAAATLYPKLKSATGYRSRDDLPLFQITEGDLIITDQGANPYTGDLVVIAGPSPRLTRNVGTTSIRLIDHNWNEIAPREDNAAYHPVVALLRARRPQAQ